MVDGVGKRLFQAVEAVKSQIDHVYAKASDAVEKADEKITIAARGTFGRAAIAFSNWGKNNSLTAGFVHRATITKIPIPIRGSDLPPTCVVRPHIPTEPLDTAYRAAVMKKLDSLVNDPSSPKTNEEKKELRQLGQALNKYKTATTRKDLSPAHMQLLDSVDFELTKDYFNEPNLCNQLKTLDNKKLGGNDLHLGQAKISETLAKSLAYIDSKSMGETLNIPTKQNDGSYALVEYTIKHESVGKSKLPMYILTPAEGSEEKLIKGSKAPPYVVIRGTEPYVGKGRKGALDSIIADFSSSEGVGAGIVSDKYLLQAHAEAFKQAGGAIFTGHSLGGTLATLLSLRMDASAVRGVDCFNSTGIGKKEAKEAEAKLENTKNIVNYFAQGDIVTGAGAVLVGKSYTFDLPDAHTKDAARTHVEHVITEGAAVHEVDTQAENDALHRKAAEGLRKGAGPVFATIEFFQEKINANKTQ
jgi:hypothetical protein